MGKHPEKVILISGGSRGLGRGLVETMLKDGNRVATFSRASSSFVETCFQHYPDSFFWEAVDGSNTDGIKQFARMVMDRYARIDVLINNAGIGTDGIITLMSEDDIRRILSVNLEAAIHLSRACLKSMMQQSSGCIVNISSVNALRGHSGVAVYSATKAALDGLTRSLARELGPLGIRVNSVAPGYFQSEMSEALTEAQQSRIVHRTPLGRLGTIDDLVGIIRFLISAEAGFITGQTIVVDGGLTC